MKRNQQISQQIKQDKQLQLEMRHQLERQTASSRKAFNLDNQ